jgi:hypothetical protein
VNTLIPLLIKDTGRHVKIQILINDSVENINALTLVLKLMGDMSRY